MRAIILAGGKGTRLRPYTLVLPKPLIPVGDLPILEIVVKQLVENGFNHITMAVNHQAEMIKAFFGDGSKWNVKIDYSLESKPLSTMGPLKLIPDLPENFLIMNGDILTDINFSELMQNHIYSKNVFSLPSIKHVVGCEYGVLIADESGKVKSFVEKPKTNYNISIGIYIANKKIMQFIPENEFFGFDHLMDALLKNNYHVQLIPFDGYWLDIGRPEDYQKAIEVFETEKKRFLKSE